MTPKKLWEPSERAIEEAQVTQFARQVIRKRKLDVDGYAEFYDWSVEHPEEFWGEVRRLPRRQAQALSLHYVYDLGVSETALTMGCSESSVKAHLVRGRARLAERLGTGEVRRP